MAKVPTDLQWADLANRIKAKADSTAIPTAVSQLTNDSGYQTSSDVTSAINTAIAGITQFDYEIVQTLPATGDKGTIYLVPSSGSSPDSYDEYVYVNNAWEKLGSAFTLPIASSSTLGGVKIGSRISIASDGTISADMQYDEFTTAQWNALWS